MSILNWGEWAVRTVLLSLGVIFIFPTVGPSLWVVIGCGLVVLILEDISGQDHWGQSK